MNLFRLEKCVLSGGGPSDFKICCEAFSREDWACLAFLLSTRVEPFSAVLGVPTGGDALALALRAYVTPPDTPGATVLLVDDVLTTGKQLEELRRRAAKVLDPDCLRGAVVFFRGAGVCPDWVTALLPLAPVKVLSP